MRLLSWDPSCSQAPPSDDPLGAGVVVQRAVYLSPEDHRLLTAVLDHGVPLREISRLLGLSPRRIRYRVAALSLRLRSPRFVAAMRALPHLDAESAEIILRHVLRHQPVRDVAREMGLTIHHVRRRLALAEGFIAERSARMKLTPAETAPETQTAP